MKNKVNISVNNYFLYNDLKRKKIIYFSLFVLLFSVIRGLVPLITLNGSLAEPTYSFSFFLGLLLASYGFYKVFFSKMKIIRKEIRYLLILNFILTIYWLLPLLIFIPSFNLLVGLAYKCWFPFAVYAFMTVPEKKLIPIFQIITLVVAGFVLYDFISLNTNIIPNGYDLTVARYELLRPETFRGISKNTLSSGIVLRPNGILGSGKLPHDSGNVLALFSVYWLAMSFRKDVYNYTVPLLAVFSLITILLSQSTSNIVACIFGLLIVLFFYKRNIFSFKNIMKILFFLFPLCIWIYNKIENVIGLLWAWTRRLSLETGDWEGMTYLGDSSFGSNLFSFLFGYGQSLGISEVSYYGEQAFTKIIFEYGIVNAIIFFLLLLMPLIFFLFNKNHLKKFEVFPYVIAIFVGFLSLWHYGSVLRTTNIFIFFAFYGQFMRKYTFSNIEKNTNKKPLFSVQ